MTSSLDTVYRVRGVTRALILYVVKVCRQLGVIPDSSLTVIKILFLFLWCSENDFKF